MIGGIYKITNKINNKSYIGFSNNIPNRWYAHMSGNTNPKLSADIKKYGLENFRFDILDLMTEDYKINHSEAYYINTFDTIKHGYNTERGDIITDYSSNKIKWV